MNKAAGAGKGKSGTAAQGKSTTPAKGKSAAAPKPRTTATGKAGAARKAATGRKTVTKSQPTGRTVTKGKPTGRFLIEGTATRRTSTGRKADTLSLVQQAAAKAETGSGQATRSDVLRIARAVAEQRSELMRRLAE